MGNPQVEDGFIRIATELFDALCKIKMSGESRQVFDFIIRKTYGWQKKEDNISFSQIEAGTGICRRNAIRAIKRLRDMNMISVKIDTSTGNLYAINKKYSTWKVVAKIPPSVKNAPSSVKTCTKVVSKMPHTIDTTINTNTIDIDTFHKYWLGKINKQEHEFWLTELRKNAIRSRLAEGRTVDDLKRAADNYFNDGWEERKKFAWWERYEEYVLRTTEKLESWINKKKKHWSED